MPYIENEKREECLEQGLEGLVQYLMSVPVETRKGFVAYCVKFLGKHCFKENYFGKSTGTDAVRSALREMIKDLDSYENTKRLENGDV